MGLDITLFVDNDQSHVHFSYHTIHILRDYAAQTIGEENEDSKKAQETFPNLIWHNDTEGFYVGWLPEDWPMESQIHVGSVEGLYKELQRISAHMIQTEYEGEAKRVLQALLKLFADLEYDLEENASDAFIQFT